MLGLSCSAWTWQLTPEPHGVANLGGIADRKKEKTTPFSINLTRSLVIYKAAYAGRMAWRKCIATSAFLPSGLSTLLLCMPLNVPPHAVECVVVHVLPAGLSEYQIRCKQDAAGLSAQSAASMPGMLQQQESRMTTSLSLCRRHTPHSVKAHPRCCHFAITLVGAPCTSF